MSRCRACEVARSLYRGAVHCRAIDVPHIVRRAAVYIRAGKVALIMSRIEVCSMLSLTRVRLGAAAVRRMGAFGRPELTMLIV